jgi:hypothetical protein
VPKATSAQDEILRQQTRYLVPQLKRQATFGWRCLQLGQVNVAGMACYPNGLISRDANGGVLSCQSGA